MVVLVEDGLHGQQDVVLTVLQRGQQHLPLHVREQAAQQLQRGAASGAGSVHDNTPVRGPPFRLVAAVRPRSLHAEVRSGTARGGPPRVVLLWVTLTGAAGGAWPRGGLGGS